MNPIGRLTQQTDLSEDSGHPPHHPSKGRGRGEALQRDKLKTGLKYMATRTSDPWTFKARIFWKTYLSLGQTISAHGNRRWRVLKYFVPRAFGVLCQSSAQNEKESKWSITFSRLAFCSALLRSASIAAIVCKSHYFTRLLHCLWWWLGWDKTEEMRTRMRMRTLVVLWRRKVWWWWWWWRRRRRRWWLWTCSGCGSPHPSAALDTVFPPPPLPPPDLTIHHEPVQAWKVVNVIEQDQWGATAIGY